MSKGRDLCLVFIILSAILTLFPVLCYAQYHESDNDEDPVAIRDTANPFCIKLSRIMLDADDGFSSAKDALVDTEGQKAWDVKTSYQMPGSKHCAIFSNGNKTTYVAFFISKNNKDDLGSSYNNLLHQLKDCLGFNYVYTEKKTTKADMLLRHKNYDCEMVPYGDAIPEQADMRVYIQKTPDGNYELILEIMKYKGMYIKSR